LNMGGVFMAFAVKIGGSHIWHKDWHDHPDYPTFVVAGEHAWKGGDFLALQPGFRVPVRPGQMLVSFTRRLVHCAT
ncbi:hypothetical protein K435DRAFT_618525, partial [Dendrothele bispora CBS 962.96]